MTEQNSIIQTIFQGGWDGFVAAGSQMANSISSFFLQMIMIAMVFTILFGVLFHFTNYHGVGKKLIVNGILGMIIVCVFYTWIFGGLPDITVWFRPPA